MEEERKNIDEYTEEEKDQAMSRALHWLCSPRGGNNFYGRILNGCGRAPRKDLWPPTAAVSLDTKGRYTLAWQPDWFVRQEGPFQLLVVVHEAAHLSLQHLEKFLRLRLRIHDINKYKRLHPLMNVAADMAANDIAVRPLMRTTRTNFEKYREKFIWPESEPYKYPTGESFEYYFSRLLDDMTKEGFDVSYCGGESSEGEEGESSGPGDKLDDNYPQWFKDLVNKQSPPALPWDTKFDEMNSAEIERAIDRAKREAKRITKNAVEQTQKSRGTIPGQFMEAIKDLLEEPTIPWQVVFQNMMRTALSSKLDESTAYPNPCFFHLEDEGMEPYPGYQKNFALDIAIMVDTSGSVSRQEFVDFMAEIRGIASQEDEVTIRLIMFDAAIQYEKLLTSEDTDRFAADRHNSINRYGHGGTDFSPPLRYICGEDDETDWANGAEREDIPMNRMPDMAVLLTDGGAPVGPPHGPIPKYLPPCPLIWVLSSCGVENDYMQPRVLKIAD